MNDFIRSAAGLLKRNRFAFICSVCGLVLAILFLTIGFFKALLVAALVCAGAAGGVFLDRRFSSGGGRGRDSRFGGYDSSSFHPFDDDN